MSSTSSINQGHKQINMLLRGTAEILASSLGANHIRLMFRDHTMGNRHVVEYDGQRPAEQTAAARLDSILDSIVQVEIPDGLERLPTSGNDTDCTAYTPSPGLLQEHGLRAGLFLARTDGGLQLAMFGGSSTTDATWGESETLRACEILDTAALALVQIAALFRIIDAKHQCESTMDTLPQLIALLDAQGHVIRTNMTLEKWSLGMVEAVQGINIHDMLHPSCNDWYCRLRELFDQMWQQFEHEQTVEHELHDTQLGRDLHLKLIRYPESRYVHETDNPACASLIIEDISRRAQAERMLKNYNEELERQLQARTLDLTRVNAQLKDKIEEQQHDAIALGESNKKYTCLVEATLTGIYVIRDNRLVFCNGRFSRIFDYPHDEIYELDLKTLFPEEDTETLENITGSCQALEPTFDRKVVTGLNRNGDTLWLLRTLTQVDYMGTPMIVGNIIDITDQKMMENDLRGSRHELELLSKRLINAEEAERQRIAAELHDSIGQSINAVKFSVENALRESGSTSQQCGSTHLHNAVAKLRETMDEVRKIAMDLRPSLLDDLGLISTISWFCRDLQSLVPQCGLNIQMGVEEAQIPPDLKIVIFRILQEALNNICKHAHASNVSVSLTNGEDALELLIEDDGKGFDMDSLSATNGFGFGLASMRERAALSGGKYMIVSTPGKGTTIRAIWVTQDGNSVSERPDRY